MRTKAHPAIGQLFRGKLRRFYLGRTRRGKAYISRMMGRRLGECRRCGACCRLVHRCPFLQVNNGTAKCAIHKLRPANCRVFPIDPRDLADRDRIRPDDPCGFSFE